MHIRAKMATTLRRLADRLAPVPAGDCGSGTTFINFGGAGVRTSTGTEDQIIADPYFDAGEGSPA